jgi:hypothetical protein
VVVVCCIGGHKGVWQAPGPPVLLAGIKFSKKAFASAGVRQVNVMLKA